MKTLLILWTLLLAAALPAAAQQPLYIGDFYKLNP